MFLKNQWLFLIIGITSATLAFAGDEMDVKTNSSPSAATSAVSATATAAAEQTPLTGDKFSVPKGRKLGVLELLGVEKMHPLTFNNLPGGLLIEYDAKDFQQTVAANQVEIPPKIKRVFKTLDACIQIYTKDLASQASPMIQFAIFYALRKKNEFITAFKKNEENEENTKEKELYLKSEAFLWIVILEDIQQSLTIRPQNLIYRGNTGKLLAIDCVAGLQMIAEDDKWELLPDGMGKSKGIEELLTKVESELDLDGEKEAVPMETAAAPSQGAGGN